jgi:NADH-quinone oxidoreductase subunit N
MDSLIHNHLVTLPLGLMLSGFICTLFCDLLGMSNWVKWVSFSFMVITLAVFLTSGVEKCDILFGDKYKTLFCDDFNYKYCAIAVFAGCIALAMSIFQTKNIAFKLPSEFYILIFPLFISLFALSSARHALVFYVAIEMVSVLSYVMVSLQKKQLQYEASFRYLSIGVASSAFMILGMSWLVMQTGSLQLDDWFWNNNESQQTLLGQVPLLLFLAGLLLKVTAFPLHLWAPDVYEAGPTPIIALLSVAPKIVAAGFMASYLHVMPILVGVVVITILIGNLGAIFQQNAKRLMAYSSIAQAAFLLIPSIISGESREQVFLLYASVYAPMKLAFFVGIYPVEQQMKSVKYESFQGLGKKYPLFFGLFTLAVVSLIGLPPTGGLTAKLILFTNLFGYPFSGEFLWIYHVAMWVAVASIGVSIYYYLAVPFKIWFRPKKEEVDLQISTSDYAILFILAILFVLPFINPSWIIAR